MDTVMGDGKMGVMWLTQNMTKSVFLQLYNAGNMCSFFWKPLQYGQSDATLFLHYAESKMSKWHLICYKSVNISNNIPNSAHVLILCYIETKPT